MALVWQSSHFGQHEQSELLAMLALADWANDHGESWPSVNHLCHKARISERHWIRVKKKLIEKGLIEIKENDGTGAGNRRTNRYKINLQKFALGGDAVSVTGGHLESDTVSVSGGHPPDTVSVTQLSPGGDIARRGNRHIEPSLMNRQETETRAREDRFIDPPNTFVPPKRQHFIDLANPPFNRSGMLGNKGAQDAVRNFVKHRFEKFGLQYTAREFHSLLNILERLPDTKAIFEAIDTTISNGWKNLRIPDQANYK